MNKFDEFKSFCKDKPYLIDKVEKGKTTWQELFEIYDIYGEDAEQLKEEVVSEKEEESSEERNEPVEEEKVKKEGLSGILEMLSGFDPDKLSDSLNSVKKIISVLSEVTKPEENEYVTKRKMKRPYQRSDD